MPALSAAQQVTAAGQTLSFTPPTSGATTTDKIASAVVFNRSGFDLLILAPGVGFVAAWGQANVSFGTPLLSYGQAFVQVASEGSGTAGPVYVAWYEQGQPPPPPVGASVSQVTASVAGNVTVDSGTVDISGNVSTFLSQIELTGSPYTFTASPESVTFAIPADAPDLDGLMIVPYPSGMTGYVSGEITIVGATTGATYMQQSTINTTPYVCDFSSVAEPGGVTINYHLYGGAGTGTRLRVLGLNRSQITRPIHGALAEGPTAFAENRAVNAGTATLLSVPQNGQYRIWELNASMAASGTNENLGGVQLGGNYLLPLETIGANTTASNAITIEGGLPMTSLQSLVIVAPGSGAVSASVLYSVDA